MVALADVARRLPGVSERTVQVRLADAVRAGVVVRIGEARATRYALAGAPVEPAAGSVSRVNLGPAVAPVAVEASPEKPAPTPCTKAPTPRAPSVGVPVVVIPPPPVVAEGPVVPSWLAAAVSPERLPDELLAARFYLDGPHAVSLGVERAWNENISRPLVLKLHAVAAAEAKRHGEPPPTIEVVARHTSTWYAVAAAG